MSRVFRKTALGKAILTRPNSGVTSFERALLTMIDGKRDASDIRRRLATFGNVNAVLRELFEDRLIELDPVYAQQFATTQKEIAQESGQFSGRFGPTTTATIGRGANLPTSTRDLSDALPPMESAFNSVSIGEAQPTAPFDPWSDEVRTPAISAWAMGRAQDFAKLYLFKATGASGAALCLSIERANNVKELLRLTQAASAAIHKHKGSEIGAEFDRRLQKFLLED